MNSVYVSVVNVRSDGGDVTGKLVVVQGIAYFRIGKIITISATLLGEYDPDTLTDPLELFNQEPETEAEREEAMRTRNKFYDLSGDTIRRNDFIGEAGKNNGLYFLYDTHGVQQEKEYVFTATGLLDLDWLKKIGVNCGLKVGAIGAYNAFKSEWEVGLGVKFTVPSGTEWLVVGRVGFKSGRLNNIALEFKGEIPIGPVIFTQIKMGVSGLAESVQTYAPGLGVAFGPQIDFNALSSKFAKMIGLKNGKFRVAEAAVFGEVSSDFQNMSLSVEGTFVGLLEVKGGWKYEDGKNEISLSVGTRKSETFNFRISGSVCWGGGDLTVKGSLDGSFKWDFTALGITWVGVNVGGGLHFGNHQVREARTGAPGNGRHVAFKRRVPHGVQARGDARFWRRGERHVRNARGVRGFFAHGGAVFAVQRHVKHAAAKFARHVRLQLQAALHGFGRAAVVVAHGQRGRQRGICAVQGVARVDGHGV